MQEKTEAELAILMSYLLVELSDEELTAVIKEVLADIGETGKDIGKLMGLVMQKVKGRVNGQRVRQKVEEFLQK